jgi:hypothetical protein
MAMAWTWLFYCSYGMAEWHTAYLRTVTLNVGFPGILTVINYYGVAGTILVSKEQVVRNSQ